MLNSKNDKGHILIGVLILLTLSSLIVTSSLIVSSGMLHTSYNSKLRSDRFYEAEESIGKSISWLRDNSKKMLTPFDSKNFYTLFEVTNPSVGVNDTSEFPVPTKLKIKGSNDSIIITNEGLLATSQFPETSDIKTGKTFDAIAEMISSNLGGAKVRITLVDAIPEDPSKNYGPPPAADPETNFVPVYRVDALTGAKHGAHVFATITSSLNTAENIGFYGEESIELRQNCDSYDSSLGIYNPASKKAGCTIGSAGVSSVHSSTSVYGSLQTTGVIDLSSPFGGKICADFTSGCPTPGQICEGPDCSVPEFDAYKGWSEYCPSQKSPLTVNSNTSLTLPTGVDLDSQSNLRCWQSVTIRSNRTLTLSSDHYPYYIQTLTLQNSSNSKLNISPDTANGTVELWVNSITGNSINGNQSINSGGRPGNFKLVYLGSDALTLNGTADMKAQIIAPNAEVVISGNFDFYGSVVAKKLSVTGSGSIHYDESLAGPPILSNVQYRLAEMVQIYR
jgi:hypothetical protein